MSLTAIDLFAGAGGLSLGLLIAGWNVTTAVEIDAWAAKTHHLNFPNTAILPDVRAIDFGEYKGIDLIAGGPPCQPFSVAGKQLSSSDHRDMVPQFIRAVKEAHPKAFLMENVPGLLTNKHRSYTAQVISQLEDQEYLVYSAELDAASYGVPQHRRRVFIVGFSDSIDFVFPSRTHGPGTTNKFVTVKEALSDVPKCEPNSAKVTYAKKPIWRPSPWAGLLLNGQGRPLNLEEPSKTIPASAGGNRTHIIDPEGILFAYHKYLENGGIPKTGVVHGVRRLNTRESARLQSFPDDFEFVGPKSKIYSQIGNAVPPLLAFAVSKAILDALYNNPAGVASPAQLRLF